MAMDSNARLAELAHTAPVVDATAAESSKRRERIEASGIRGKLPRLPTEDLNLIVSDARLRPTHALEVARRWYARASQVPYRENALVLCGLEGRGKTFAAAWALSQRRGRYATFPSMISLARKQETARTAAEREEASRLDDLLTARLLVVDELGLEKDRHAEDARSLLFDVFDTRQSRGVRLTMVLTNMSAAELDRRCRQGVYDPRLASRLARMAIVADVDGPDLRRTGWEP